VLDRAAIRRILFQGVVDAVLVKVGDVVTNEAPQVSFVQRDHIVEEFAVASATGLSAMPFCQGAWRLVRFGVRSVDCRNVTTAELYCVSRSRMTCRYGPASGNASRNCCTIRSQGGWRVTLTCRILRRQ
jgi:hypothetical protein